MLGEIRVCQRALGPPDPTGTPNLAHTWEGASDAPGAGLPRGWEGRGPPEAAVRREQAARIAAVPALIWLFHLLGAGLDPVGDGRGGRGRREGDSSIQGTRV